MRLAKCEATPLVIQCNCGVAYRTMDCLCGALSRRFSLFRSELREHLRMRDDWRHIDISINRPNQKRVGWLEFQRCMLSFDRLVRAISHMCIV